MVKKVLGCQSLTILLIAAGGIVPAWAQNTFPASGNVGIGTMNPQRPLHIIGDTRLNRLDVLTSTSGGNSRSITFQPDDGTSVNTSYTFNANPGGGSYGAFTINSKGVPRVSFAMEYLGGTSFINVPGNLGVGTMDPQLPFHVVGNARLNNVDVLTSVSGGNSRSITFQPDDGTSVNTSYTFNANPGGGSYGAFTINSKGVPRVSFAMEYLGGTSFINLPGNFGIGTTNPAATLHVAGNAQIDGNIAAKYQDVAEWVRATSKPSPGTVVMIDSQNPGQVVASDKPYDSRVAGVVSPQPGILLGEPGEDKAMIAHNGRVRVKVDAHYGAIAVGDLLVTSPTPGYAMRSEPVNVGGVEIHRPGTLIGKALEPLKAGQAEILVLLTLQ